MTVNRQPRITDFRYVKARHWPQWVCSPSYRHKIRTLMNQIRAGADAVNLARWEEELGG